MTQPPDFSAFGEVELVPFTRLQKFGSAAFTRSWTSIPHVTHHDEADITALEKRREAHNAAAPDVRLSPTSFIIKAVATTLQGHPRLNASLDAGGTQLVLKKYFNIGVAIDTPAGLLVGVLRGCDRKSVPEIAAELSALSRKAREKGLNIEELSGGTFTVTSLGGIGGTAFTPIINAPEVAILGIAKAQWKPARGPAEKIDWRLMLPLSLSYDHRAVNGADAARFVKALADTIAAIQIQ